MKRCTGCDVLKPLEDFPPDKALHGGYRNQCRVCRRKTNRKATARWRAKNRGYFRRYYEQNREEMLAQQKETREADLEAARARARAAYHVNPEPQKAISRRANNRRRARLAGLPSEDIDLRLVFERDEGTCGICGGSVDPDDWHLDHIVPIALGGPHVYSNVQVSHPLCNLSKGAKCEASLEGEDIERTGDPRHEQIRAEINTPN